MFFVAALLSSACAQERTPPMTLEEAQEALADRVMSLPGVTGIGVGECDGEPCIRVMVARVTQELTAQIPKSYEGFVVAIDETGDIEAH